MNPYEMPAKIGFPKLWLVAQKICMQNHQSIPNLLEAEKRKDVWVAYSALLEDELNKYAPKER